MNASLFKALPCPEAIISYKALVRLIPFSSTAMISPDLIRTVVGIIGNVIALSLFLSPVPTFYKIWKKGSVEQFSPVPYLATLLNCMLWVVYGLPLVHPHSTLVLTINGLGLIIELTYVLLFLLYSNGRARIRVLAMLLTEIVFVGLITVIVLSTAHTLVTRSLIIGVLCVFFGTMMYAAPLSVMKLVIQTKSVEYMPLFLSVASFLNGICWTTYALIRFDLFITIPNALGTMFSVAQLVLHAMYYKSTKIQMEARKRKLDMGFEEVMAPVENTEKIRGASQTGNYPPV